MLDNGHDIEIKWAAFSAHEEDWPNGWDFIRDMKIDKTILLYMSSRKEIRSGRVEITRKGEESWGVDGEFSDGWDDTNELADTVGVLLIDGGYDHWRRYFKHSSCGMKPLKEVFNYLMTEDGYQPGGEDLALSVARTYHEVQDTDAFRESVPWAHGMDSNGVTHAFGFVMEGTVEDLMMRIDAEEDELISLADTEWKEFKRMYKGGEAVS